MVETIAADAGEEEHDYEGKTLFGLSDIAHGIVVIVLCGWIAYRAWSLETVMQMRAVGGDDLVSRCISFAFLVSLCMFSGSIGQVADADHPNKTKFLGDYFLAYVHTTTL